MQTEVQPYQKTIVACFAGYIVQAIVNNFVPLLFLTFQRSYQIPLSRITLLITFNFGIQLLIDLWSAFFIDRMGYRAAAVIAHACAAAGLVLLTFLPQLLPDPFIGILISVMIYAIGGGLCEVIISPMVEACPTPNKEKAMSLLHSFYSWGQVAVVGLSTLFFVGLGLAHWRILALIWAVVPLLNLIAFTRVPIAPLIGEGEAGMTLKQLINSRIFWIFILMMFCAGASEQAVSQWASTFAESGLKVSKTVGDLAGPLAFAVMMGLSRLYYGRRGERIKLDRFMFASGLLCVLSYLIIALAPYPALGLLGCALCGLAVGIMWPGTFSKAAASIKNGGTAMFALFALAGDLGCAGGPTFVGLMTSVWGNDLHQGILTAVIFPVLLLLSLLLSGKRPRSLANVAEP
ncbi:MAG: MFS transporter [Oscillospiraceae bacterium]|nr:MFS transporter [Oscillospiraceae bacterium]MDD4367812.1 MFS transporter [Oscillospiraceae bacterium]